MMSSAKFVFVVCQPRSARWLKAELLHPRSGVESGLRFAFSRPGLLTFKQEGELPAGLLDGPLIRVWGHSLGRAASEAELLELIAASGLAAPLRLHVFERDPPDLETLEGRDEVAQLGSRAAAVALRLRAAGAGPFHESPVAAPGDCVLDVICAPASEPEEPWLIGWHRHTPDRSPLPGGPLRITPPPEAPSRAWSKLEEAVAWSGLPLRAGQTALEIGCAPGGMTLALLQRGLTVVGVDPGDMDPRVFSCLGERRDRFTHLQQPVGALTRHDLPARVDWLLSDVNLAPPVALRYVGRLVHAIGPALRGVVLTLKLNDDRMRAAIPEFLERVRSFGLGEPQTTQLPSNRSEITVIARRR